MNFPPVARRAFTLIELLVVVAIIALLLAILLPSLARAREQSKRTACGANLKAIGAGIALYGSEYDALLKCQRGVLPSNWAANQNVYYRNDIANTWPGWSYSLAPYCGGVTSKILVCPSLTTDNIMLRPLAPGSPFNGPGTYGGSTPWIYGAYFFYSGDPGNNGFSSSPYWPYAQSNPSGQRFTLLDNQSTTFRGLTPNEVLATDCMYVYGVFSYGNHPILGQAGDQPEIYKGLTSKQNYAFSYMANDPNAKGDGFAGFNASFGDGHVEWVPIGKANRYWAQNWGQWGFIP